MDETINKSKTHQSIELFQVRFKLSSFNAHCRSSRVSKSL